MATQSVPGEASGQHSALAVPPQDRRLYRSNDGSVIAGVCTGIARHLNWPVLPVRIAFVALGTQLIGLLVYAALWLLVPIARPHEASQPGLASAERRGLRPETEPATARPVDKGALFALIALGVGLFALVTVSGLLGTPGQVLWPLIFAGFGVVLIWRQADAATIREVARDTAGQRWLTPLVLRGRFAATVRLVIGIALIVAAFTALVGRQLPVAAVPAVVGTSILAVAGVGIVVAPWALRLRASLNEAREQKVRADERADLAAHLHDSVLQTLALIQRQADDPKAVQALARRQERELRSWLYGDAPEASTFKAAIATAASDIEDERDVEVEVVVVGDCPLDESVDAVVRATREGLMNAAKHSGCDTVSVYAEASEDVIEVFIRDRGVGFDMDAIGADRMGVRRSIIDRMERHGGTAEIRSAPGEGTEVRLELKR